MNCREDMAKLKEDKKREVLEFVEERADEDALLPLGLERIIERFSDEIFDEYAVREVIDELEDDGLLVKKTAKMDVVYPAGYDESVEEKFSHYFVTSSNYRPFLVGGFAYFVLLQWSPFLDFIYDVTLPPREAVINYSFLGVIAMYFLGKLTIIGYDKLQGNIELVRANRYLIYPILSIAAASSVVVWLFSSYSSQPVTTNHIIGIITVSVVGGAAVGNYFGSPSDN